MKLQYFGLIRAAAGKSEEEMALSADTSVYALLQRLSAAYGGAFRDEIFEAGGHRLREDVTVTLNGAVIAHAAAGDICPKPGDTLALFPIFPGGG